MRILSSIAILLFLAATDAQAADPVLQSQIDALAQRITTLTNELNTLKSMLSRTSDGTVALTAAQGMDERVGTNSRTLVGAASQRTVGGSSSETVGGSQSLQVTGSQTVSVGHNQSNSIGGAQRTNIGTDALTQAARTIALTAGDQLTLRTGSALLVMKKDGTIQITGTNIQISGSGDVVIKGSKVLTN